MYHFLALLWSPDDLPAREEAAQLEQRLRRSSLPWERLLDTDGAAVFALAPTDPSLRPYALPAQAGVVLGKLFSADVSQSNLDPRIDERTAQEIVRTQARHLVRNFWGGYVAVLADPPGRCAYVIRDCSGKIPCYYRRFRHVTIVFADLNDLASLELPPATPNWEYLAAFIYSSQLQVR